MAKEKTKSKSGKKFIGRQSSFLQFSSKPAKHRFKNEREGVLCSLRTFRRLCANAPSSRSSLDLLAKFKEQYPHLLINRRHGGEGSVPGIEVGDSFRYRAELALVDLHRPPQAGIDWKDFPSANGNIVSLALSVVVSGWYEDDEDKGETLIYTGEGGNDFKNGSTRQYADQKLQGGNEALRNSCILKKSVRVIRGRQSSSGTVYSYDGVYQVIGWSQETGVSRFKVFKFKLVREPGQKPLFWPSPVP